MLRLIYTRFQHFSILHLALLSTTLVDEIVSGFPIVGLPLIRDQLNLSYAQIGLLLSIGSIVGLVTDPMINLLSDRTPSALLDTRRIIHPGSRLYTCG
jgi:predicted MFS family arabinose efflux permease